MSVASRSRSLRSGNQGGTRRAMPTPDPEASARFGPLASAVVCYGSVAQSRPQPHTDPGPQPESLDASHSNGRTHAHSV